ncbi:hypothetical protein DKM44_00845 [Deinococcus irradiatisoli]|uniref:beta-mannosidase n=1 Tax=Deinococcus irradiatisoli TaxID=2202254 RepID=A0A2Z3JEY7_9DEIO|nr:glycoside hydrolase family 2 TIM barrel-domain containing protein [Deinococcus irradiatisoli]AWN21960.1 hypothetical protein DKM44_00845 [Deinococcus irradiatisoli]
MPVWRQDLAGEWQLAPSLDEAWRSAGWHVRPTLPVGAFARPEWVAARVPGSVHADLIRAGVLAEPNIGLNSLAAEWVSARQWVYRREFRVELPEGGRLFLHFGGVDHSATVYLDGRWLGELEGPLTPARFEVSGLDRAAAHLLVVVLAEPPAEAGQQGRTSATRSLKPRWSYGWDFATRLISAGLCGEVWLEHDGGAAILDVWVRPQLSEDLRSATVRAQVQLSGPPDTLCIATLHHPDGRSETRQGRAGELKFDLDSPALWWPAGLGEPALYTLQVSVPGARPVQRRFGLRRSRLVHNAASLERGARPYTLEINGQRLYARGFNVLPVDLIAGRGGEAQRERDLIRLARQAHANLLRFNGVAPLASTTVLDACDELGVMVWQELPLTSSGVDQVPPESAEFLAALERGAPPLIEHLRHHPSVVIYGGGNELTDDQRRPLDETHPLLSRIGQLFGQYGDDLPYLPTSPSGPVYDLDGPDLGSAEQHDVHGPWHYRGVHDTYRPLTLSRALMHSEFGCQAPARAATLERYLHQTWPMTDAVPDVVHHGPAWMMRHRLEEVFGPLHDLKTYTLLGQAAQGDVLRHALLHNRARREECSAALVWQLNEPWPGAHNTSVLDYDLKPKLAFYRCREANAPVAVHLGLPGPVVGGELRLRPEVLADEPGRGTLILTLSDVGGTTLQAWQGEVDWPAPPAELDWPAPSGPSLLRAELTRLEGAPLARAEYWLAPDRPAPFADLVALPATTLQLRQQGGALHMTNTGRWAAPWISIEAAGPGAEDLTDNGFSLLPGEEVVLEARFDEGASVTAQALNTVTSELIWRSM